MEVCGYMSVDTPFFVTALPRTDFELFAGHQDLCIRNDGGRQAVLQPVRFSESIKEMSESNTEHT